MRLYDYKQAIKDFVGKDGYVAFEHGFKSSIDALGVSDTEVEFPYGETIKIDELNIPQARTLLRDLLEYLNYCRYYA